MIKEHDRPLAAALRRGYLKLGCPADEADELIAEAYRLHYLLDAVRDEHLSGLGKNLLFLVLQLETALMQGVSDALADGDEGLLVTASTVQ